MFDDSRFFELLERFEPTPGWMFPLLVVAVAVDSQDRGDDGFALPVPIVGV